jgi:hypothetical protein
MIADTTRTIVLSRQLNIIYARYIAILRKQPKVTIYAGNMYKDKTASEFCSSV